MLKVRIYSIKSTTVYVPSSELGLSPPPLSRQRVCPSPQNRGGGAHSPAGEGLGESQIRRLEESLALCLLCGLMIPEKKKLFLVVTSIVLHDEDPHFLLLVRSFNSRGSVYAASLLDPAGIARFLLVVQERLQRPGRGWDDPDPVGRLWGPSGCTASSAWQGVGSFQHIWIESYN